MRVSAPSSDLTVSMTPSTLLVHHCSTRSEVSIQFSLQALADFLVHYVQSQNKVESILASIRETISGGVEFAEEKLAQVLDVSE
jgi:hypothetical protein